MADQWPAKKGQGCLDLARKAIVEMEEGKTKMVSKSLTTLQTAGKELAEHTARLAKRLEKVQEYFQKQEVDILQQIGVYGHQQNEKQSEMNMVQQNLTCQHTILQQNRDRLSQAQKELCDAESSLSRKQTEAEHTAVGSTLLGLAVGILTGGIGAGIVCAVGSATVATAITELSGNVDRAKSAVMHRKTDCSKAESEIRKIEQQVSNVRSQLNELSSQKAALENQQFEYHQKAAGLKEVIVILHEARSFWLEFKLLSDHSVDRTTLLKRIIEKADSQANFESLSKCGTKKVAGTVLDAWREIASIEEGSNQFLFAIQYQCTKCSQHCNDLPYVEENKVICHACNQSICN